MIRRTLTTTPLPLLAALLALTFAGVAEASESAKSLRSPGGRHRHDDRAGAPVRTGPLRTGNACDDHEHDPKSEHQPRPGHHHERSRHYDEATPAPAPEVRTQRSQPRTMVTHAHGSTSTAQAREPRQTQTGNPRRSRPRR